MGAFEGGHIVGFLDEGVNGQNLFGRLLASGAFALVVILFETGLADGLLASLALDRVQRQLETVRAGQHLEDDVFTRVQTFQLFLNIH